MATPPPPPPPPERQWKILTGTLNRMTEAILDLKDRMGTLEAKSNNDASTSNPRSKEPTTPRDESEHEEPLNEEETFEHT